VRDSGKEGRSMRVAVILGGNSPEREVSLHTGENIIAALREKGHETVAFDVTAGLGVRLQEAEPDCVYIALHGRYGEDGCVQGLLEILGVPYVGSGVLASALGMDKLMSRRLFVQAGLPCPRYRVLDSNALERRAAGELAEELIQSFGLPLVVKPNNQGSAIGVTIARDRTAVQEGLAQAFTLGEVALVEEYVAGPEITVTVLGNTAPRALPVIEIVPKKAFYDYEAKYTPGCSEHLIPARIPAEAAAAAQEQAVRAYAVLGCRDFARVDFLVDQRTAQPVLLEVNTLPGMTSTSLVPDAARAVGLEFPDLVEQLVRMAAERKE
jgi:D-alanine-D-alanine ligase